jgi:hypothetical protein
VTGNFLLRRLQRPNYSEVVVSGAVSGNCLERDSKELLEVQGVCVGVWGTQVCT